MQSPSVLSPILWLMRRFAPKEENPVWMLLERFLGSSRYLRYDWVLLPILLLAGCVGSFTHHPLSGLVAAIAVTVYLTSATHVFTVRLVRAGWVGDLVMAPISNREFWKTFARLFWVLVPAAVVPLLGCSFLAMLSNGVPLERAGAASAIPALYLLAFAWGNHWSSFITYSRASIASSVVPFGLMVAAFLNTDEIVHALIHVSISASAVSLIPAFGLAVAGFLPMMQVRSGYTEYLLFQSSKARRK